MQVYLVRHGQTKANIEESELSREANHTIPLSEEGHRQSIAVGKFLSARFQRICSRFAKIRMWNSPYTRTRQTSQSILAEIPKKNLIYGYGDHWSFDQKEHIFLVEQQLGLFEGLTLDERVELFPKMLAHYEKCKREKGMMWPQLPMGESRFNVCQRVHQTFATFHKDQTEERIDTLVIVAHGTSIRAFLTMWLNKSPEWMNDEPIPKNGSVRYLNGNTDHGYIFEGFE